jgi:hypothetical protein
MKIYNDTIQYNEPEVAYNGGWFQKEADFSKLSDFFYTRLLLNLVDKQTTIDFLDACKISSTLIDDVKTHDVTQVLSNFSFVLIDKIALKDDLVQCCFAVILNDKIATTDVSNQLLFTELKDGVATVAPIITKCQFKINSFDVVPYTEFIKYGFNGEQIVWKWNDILSDNEAKWKDITKITTTWVDKNKIDSQWKDRIIPNKF